MSKRSKLSDEELSHNAVERVKRWRKKNPGAQRRHTLKAKYGLTEEAYEALFVGQGSCCAVCGTTEAPTKHGFVVDHDHDALNVRGILCQHCNTMLGLARDNPAFLRAGAEYLEANASG